MVQFLNHGPAIVTDDAPAGTEFACFGRPKGPPAMTFIVRGIRGEDATTAVRLRADTAVAKARDLAVAGWRVFIDCPDGNRNYPDNFDNLLSDSKDDRKLPLRHSEIDLGVAV
jgi:hypothetical protein